MSLAPRDHATYTCIKYSQLVLWSRTVEGEALPRSEFHRVLSVSSAPDESWTTLTDVPKLMGWISIIEDVTELEPLARYTAVLMDRLGPFKLRADLDITVSDVKAGQSLVVHAVGEDRQVGSRLAIDATLLVEPHDLGATITIDGVYEVTGKVAKMGPGTINKKAENIMNEFFAAAESELGSA